MYGGKEQSASGEPNPVSQKNHTSLVSCLDEQETSDGPGRREGEREKKTQNDSERDSLLCRPFNNQAGIFFSFGLAGAAEGSSVGLAVDDAGGWEETEEGSGRSVA